MSIAIYLPTLCYEFVADENSQIVANPQVHSAQFIPRYFTSHVWAQMAPFPITVRSRTSARNSAW